MDKPETNAAPNAEAEPASEEKEESKKATKTNPVACIGYCPVLFFVPYLVHPDNEDENEMNRACGIQGLWMLIAFVILNLLRTIVSYLYLPGLYGPLKIAFTIVNVILLVVTVIGMLRAYNGKVMRLPVVGKIDLIKKAMGN